MSEQTCLHGENLKYICKECQAERHFLSIRHDELAQLRTENERLKAQLVSAHNKEARLRKLVAAQAEDEGLWFIHATAAEAYLQAVLRKLHAVIEEDG